MAHYIHFAGRNDSPLCFEGHEIESLVTYGLDSVYPQARLYLFEGMLYLTESDDEVEYESTMTGLLVHKKQMALPVDPGLKLTASGWCMRCSPLVLRSGNTVYPRVDFDMFFDGSVLMEMRPIRLESMEQLQERAKI